MASSQDYSRSVLRVSVAQICQNLGWNATQTSPLELLTDVLERYLEEIGKVSHRYCEQFGRTQPNLDDLGLTFRHMGINVGELEDYVRHVDPVPFAHEVVSFPAAKTTNLQFPNPNSREILQHREEHIHDHLPHMFPGMEDEVVEEPPPAPALTSQPQVQENGSTDVMSPVAGDKRPLPNSAEGPPSSKRPRVTASNLPEEAGHSQYEMTSICISPAGFLTPTRGKGRLPDSRTPPPTIRHSLTFADPAPGTNRGVDGSDANKENTVVEPSSKEPPVRISLSTGKDGATTVVSSSSTGVGKGKSDSAKSKGKKKDKVGLMDKAKKPKKFDLKKKKVKVKAVVDDLFTPDPVSDKPTVKKPKLPKIPKLPKLKGVKPKEGKLKLKVAKPPKSSEKNKEKGDSKKKQASSSAPSSSSASASESRLKDLLLSSDKFKLDAALHPGPSTSQSPRRQTDFDFVSSPPEEDITLIRQAFPPTDIFDNSSKEASPQRLVIAEAEGRAQERQEEKRLRLKNIDDTISAVLRDSVEAFEKGTTDGSDVSGVKPVPVPTESPTPKKRGRPKKVKPKEKFKSNEFIDDDVLKKETEDEQSGARSSQSIRDTIDKVIKQGAESPLPSELDAPSSQPPVTVPSTPVTGKKSKKEKDGGKEGGKEGKKKKKVDKTKSPGLKKKLKDKLQKKGDKAETPLSPPAPAVEVKPFVSDKFSNAEMKVFEFGDTDSPPPSLLPRRPSQAEREPTTPTPTPTPTPTITPTVTPTPTPIVPSIPSPPPPPPVGSDSPVDVKPLVIKSPTPEPAAVVASSASTASTPSQDQPPPLTLKIGIPKEKDKHKERSKDKEHKKEKKEKRRDKEKKKKNKDKDRDRDREHKHHHEHKHDKSKKKEETTTTAEGSGFKIKIKIGSKLGNTSSVMTVSDSKPPPEPVVVKQEIASPTTPRPEIPKLVIRRDAKDKSSQKKRKGPKALPAIKIEPRNTPPTLQPASPLPGTPPPPVLSRNNSPARERGQSPGRRSPFPAQKEPAAERSPVRKASPPRMAFSFASPSSSPPRGRPSITPPPRTPSPSRPKSPSPMPRTPSPRRHHGSHSPLSFSSPPRRSPSAGGKSPTPTPKTPSLSPSYAQHSDNSSAREREQSPDVPSKPFRSRSPPNKKPLFEEKSRSPSPAKPLFRDHSPEEEPTKPLFGSPERDASPPPSPVVSEPPVEAVRDTKADIPPPPPMFVTKPKGKVGRPRSKSPKGSSPKGKSPKVPKPNRGFGKPPKPAKSAANKSPGRGRPPKAKTLALRAALAAAAGPPDEAEEEPVPPTKPKAKVKAPPARPPPPPPTPPAAPEIKEEEEEEEMPALSPPEVKVEKSGQDSSSGSPSPTNRSSVSDVGPSGSRQRGGTVEAETVGSFIDSSTGQQVWICPSCKMQDDGSPMIGCDKCDDWYHWVCVNITKEPPEDESWFCPRCKAKQFKPKGKRGRKKKNP